MKGILIDAYNKDVREITLVEEDSMLRQMYEIIECSTVDCIALPKSNDLWVDDEGLLTLTRDSKFFKYRNFTPIHGKGLILGTTTEGECKSTNLKIEDVIDHVQFYTLDEVEELFM